MKFDTFDALHTAEPTVVEILGRTHSRLLRWGDPAAGILEGDLVERWETPDPSTWVLHLRQGVQWHDRPPVSGRTLTAQDVAAHFMRVLESGSGRARPLAQRPWEYASITGVKVPDDRRVVVETSAPDALLIGATAGLFAFLQAPEAIDAFSGSWTECAPSSVVGTGSFLMREIQDDGTLLFEAHRSGHRPPLLDSLEVSQPGELVDRFVRGRLDEVLTRDRRDAARVRDVVGTQARELARFEDSPVVTSLFVGSAPWNNPYLRRALSAGLSRPELARRLFGGRAEASGPVSPVFASFALAESELSRWPGYRPNSDEDRKDARSLWGAGGGPALGTGTVDFPAIFDPLYGASSVVCGMLNESIGGDQFKPAVESYVSISAKAASHRYGSGTPALWFGWGPPFVDPDPARLLIETYRSGGPGARSTGFRSAEVDRLLDTLGSEFDTARRRTAIGDLQRELAAGGGGGIIDWLVQRSELFRPLYVGRPAGPTPLASQHLDDKTFLNPAEPSFGRRTPAS